MVISAEDWEQQQETLAILQNNNPMEQIAKSMTPYHSIKVTLPKKLKFYNKKYE